LGAGISSETSKDYAEVYASYAKGAKEESFGLEEEICVLDVETTGISPVYEDIIEIAVAKMQGAEIIDEFSTYLNPGKPIPREITELTGISDADVADAPCFEDIAEELHAFVGSCDILAHNAAFDKSFVETALRKADCEPLSGQWLDSLVFLRLGLPLLSSFKLEDLMRAFCPDEYAQAHRAIADVRGLCKMWRIALVGLSSLDQMVLSALPNMLEDFAEAAWVRRVAELYAGIGAGAEAGTKGKGRYLRLKALRQKTTKNFKLDELSCARTKDKLKFPSSELVEHDLSCSGLAGKMYESFESRPEQGQMVAAIRTAHEQRKHLVVEAGTGVGKSLAYLVCLARLALANDITVGVATKTNALSDQLMGKELPLLTAALAQESAHSRSATAAQKPEESCGAPQDPSAQEALLPAPHLRYASLKGYSHYPCLRKFSSVLSSDSWNYPLASAQLLSWISQTSWAELSSANLPLPYRERQTFAASSADCMRRRCTYYFQCYLHGARKIARAAHIVVTNHSLLFRNSAAEGKILPPVRYWAVDEAHNLEAEARKQLTRSFGEFELDASLKLISGSRGLPKRLLSTAGKFMDKGGVDKLAELIDQLQADILQLTILSGNFFAYVHDLDQHESLQAGSSHNSTYAGSKAAKTHWIGPELRESSAWGSLCNVGRNLALQLQTVLDTGRRLIQLYSDQLLELNPPTELSDFAGVMASLADMADTLDCAISEAEENLVYALSFSREYQGKRSAAIEISQLEVGERIATELLEQTDSAIFTSATLAVGSSFKRFSSGIGLDTLEASPKTLQLASSYDLPNLMRIFVPTDLPEPRSPQWEDQFIDLLHQVHLRSKGGVLTLFTSRKDMLACRDTLQDELRPEGIDVLAQDGMLSMRVLQERFIADSQASLLATKSFWEGFDASGDTLRCIVIPKLPFGRPDTPLSRERSLVYGRGAWARYDLPEAILELKQAVGRLVRTSTDSGIVVLADTRVLSKGYGKRVLEALPVEAEVLSTASLLDHI